MYNLSLCSHLHKQTEHDHHDRPNPNNQVLDLVHFAARVFSVTLLLKTGAHSSICEVVQLSSPQPLFWSRNNLFKLEHALPAH